MLVSLLVRVLNVILTSIAIIVKNIYIYYQSVTITLFVQYWFGQRYKLGHLVVKEVSFVIGSGTPNVI